MKMYRQGSYAALMLLALAGCKKEGGVDVPAQAPAAAAQPAQTVAKDVDLRDVIETNSRYVVGISYPATAAKYPGLARELVAYAKAARQELVEAVEALGNDQPTAPYELSLSFELAVETPKVVAASADGSRYTGGAHGAPLVARFVWLPEKERMLTAGELLSSPAGWQPVSDYVGEKLLEQAMVRAHGEDLPPGQRQAQMRELSRMIDEGTAPEAANFSQFQPVMDAGGRIAALRFVFPPYQVGPYSDGTQTVDVPAAVLLPQVAPDYRELFANP